MENVNWFTVAWIGWGALFAGIEGVALFNSRGHDTLSEHIWMWFGTARGSGKSPVDTTGWTRARRFVLLAFMGWLTAHFLTGGRF